MFGGSTRGRGPFAPCFGGSVLLPVLSVHTTEEEGTGDEVVWSVGIAAHSPEDFKTSSWLFKELGRDRTSCSGLGGQSANHS